MEKSGKTWMKGIKEMGFCRRTVNKMKTLTRIRGNQKNWFKLDRTDR